MKTMIPYNWVQLQRWRDHYDEQGYLLIYTGQYTKDNFYKDATDFWMCP